MPHQQHDQALNPRPKERPTLSASLATLGACTTIIRRCPQKAWHPQWPRQKVGSWRHKLTLVYCTNLTQRDRDAADWLRRSMSGNKSTWANKWPASD